jgi:hypothetical protein
VLSGLLLGSPWESSPALYVGGFVGGRVGREASNHGSLMPSSNNPNHEADGAKWSLFSTNQAHPAVVVASNQLVSARVERRARLYPMPRENQPRSRRSS